MPDHPFCRKDGLVYEHRLVAEIKLGRYLKPEESVHHINRNRFDNSPENLMVFATRSDHSAYHRGGKASEIEPGVFVVDKKSTGMICPMCGNKKDRYSKLCSVCNGKQSRRVIRPSVDTLIQECKISSYVAVGKKYGVSDKTIAHWLRDYGIDTKTVRTVKDNGKRKI